MPVDTAYTEFDYSGAAVPTTLATRAIDTDVVLTVTDGSTLPLAGDGKHCAIRINRGQSDEECIYYSQRVGNELQGCIRGADDTSALTHEAGATVDHGVTAKDAREANAVVVALGGLDGVGTLQDNVAAANTLGAAFTTTDATNTKGIYTAANTSHTWVPVYSSISDTSTVSSDGTPEARYYQIGKLVWFSINVHLRVLGGTGTGGVGITLPVAASLGAGNSLGQFANEGQGYTNRAGLNDATHVAIYRAQNVNAGVWDTSGTFSFFRISGVYEAA